MNTIARPIAGSGADQFTDAISRISGDLTQGLLGASFGQALSGRALGRRAVAWGALVGMTPDLDVLASPVSPMAEWLWHRAHSRPRLRARGGAGDRVAPL